MGLAKGIGTVATAVALVFSGANAPTGRACAQSLDGNSEGVGSSKQGTDDRIDFKAQIGLGALVNSVRGIQTGAVSNNTAIELRYGGWFGAELSSISFVDFTDRSIDSERRKFNKRLWSENEAAAEFLPIRLTIKDHEQADTRAGFIGRVRVRENTPSGETLGVFGSFGPEVRFEDEDLTIRFGLGGYYYNLLIDEEALHRRRQPKRRLRVENWGLVCRVDGQYRFDNDIRVGGIGELLINEEGDLREARARGYVDLPISTDWLFGEGNPLKNCGLYFRVTGQVRHMDFGDDNDQTAFNNDASVMFEILLEFDRFRREKNVSLSRPEGP